MSYGYHENRRSPLLFLVPLGVLLGVIFADESVAQPGWVLSHQKISDTQGGFPPGELEVADDFGTAVALLGDLDGDGVSDIAVGASGDDDGLQTTGAVWILFLNRDGTVKAHQKISMLHGGFRGPLFSADSFGSAVACSGDMDGDRIPDLAVGAPGDGPGQAFYGAVWILFLNRDGTVKAQQKINPEEGNFHGLLRGSDRFGSSLTYLGDLDGDGIGDLGVGAIGDRDGGSFRGAVWVLFLNRNGTVKAHQKISDHEGGFEGVLDNEDRFGTSVASLGDLDGDRVGDLAVGAYLDDDGGLDRGAVWMLFLNRDGTVKSHQKISSTEGGFTGPLRDYDRFGTSTGWLGDIDGDGVGDLAVGAMSDDDGGHSRGAVWVLFLNTDGSVKGHRKISDFEGGFEGELRDDDFFGSSAAALGDLDGDGATDLAVGAVQDDDGGQDRGAVWVLFLDGVCTGGERLKARCDGDGPRYQVIVKLKRGRPGALVTFRLTAEPNVYYRQITVNDQGRAKARFKRVSQGEHSVELVSCARQDQVTCP